MCIILLGLITANTQAQVAKPFLVIKVLDELGKPLSKAEVTVSKNEKPVAHEFTDSSGTIVIAALSLGTHVVKIHDGSKTQKEEVYIKKGQNDLFLEMGREQLRPIAIEAEPIIIDDSYGGSISVGGDAVRPTMECPTIRISQWNFSAQVMGGTWLSDTRAPTFQNMMNVQPND